MTNLKTSYENTESNDIAKIEYLLANPTKINDENALSILSFFGYENKEEYFFELKAISEAKDKIFTRFPEMKKLTETELASEFQKAISTNDYIVKTVLEVQYNNTVTSARIGFLDYSLECNFDPLTDIDREGGNDILLSEVCPNWYEQGGCKFEFEKCAGESIGSAINSYYGCAGLGVTIFTGAVGTGATAGSLGTIPGAAIGAAVGATVGWFGGTIATFGCMSNIYNTFYDFTCPGCRNEARKCCEE